MGCFKMSTNVSSFDPSAQEWQGLILTPAAGQQIFSLYELDPELLGVRLAVKKSGCAGFAYDLSMAHQQLADDLVFTQDGGKLFVARDMMVYVDGTTVDYVSVGLNSMFTYTNPKAQDACGCGESFSV